jgi:hypothetical protein
VLTAWPASDELTRPFLGYVKQPLNVVRVENFSLPEIEQAAAVADQFDIAYVFSTKWEPPNPLLQSLAFGKPLQQRFFDYHQDILPSEAANVLGGRQVFYQNRSNEWAALIVMEKIEDAAVFAPRCEPGSPQCNFRAKDLQPPQ